MSTLLTLPLGQFVPPIVETDRGPQAQVWGLLAGHYPARQSERRGEQRYPFPHLIYLTPMGKDNQPLPERAVVVVGKHLSERGLGFYHQKPLPYRRMIASIETHDHRWVGFQIDITWCRFTEHGWYDSGGRLLAVSVAAVPNRR